MLEIERNVLSIKLTQSMYLVPTDVDILHSAWPNKKILKNKNNHLFCLYFVSSKKEIQNYLFIVQKPRVQQ